MARLGPSYVDESLFGSARSSRMGRTGARMMGKGNNAASVEPIRITRSEWERIKASTKITTDDIRRAEEKERRERTIESQKAAKAKRDRMAAAEAERIKNLPKSYLQTREEREREEVRKKAAFLREESQDDVKSMNAMVQYARTVAVRDNQLKEKQLHKQLDKLENIRQGIIMEIDRLKKVKYYYDRQEKIRAQAKDGRKHITKQIKQNEARKRHERVLLAEEQERMKARMAVLQHEEEEVKAHKKAQAKVMLDSILKDNAQSIEAKRRAKQLDIEEDLRIQRYQEERAAKEAAAEAEKVRLAAEREAQLSKMREQQQKVADQGAALDALRAKRAAEANERKARQRDLREAEERKAKIDELQRYRAMQQLAKEYAVEEVRREQEEAYNRNYAVRKAQLAKTQEQEQRLHSQKVRHRDDLKRSIVERDAARKNSQKTFVTSGHAYVKKTAEEMAALNEVKARKIEELRGMGVPEKYLSELDRFDPETALRNDYKLGAAAPKFS
eukprot:INCI15082.1.p1 GENE.INCI15082.1~~INCI15082.1.p1  ORF type:complete len:502 (+),score=143.70 INCI15082.1:196-1701(+)